MKKWRWILMGVCAGITLVTQAQQEKKYAFKCLDQLCAPEMHGRGYVNGGDSLAATYIAREFKKAGLQQRRNSWYQAFRFGVNTFPGNMDLVVDGTVLKAGVDFIVEPNGGGGKASRKVAVYTASDLEDRVKTEKFGHPAWVNSHILVIDPAGIETPKEKGRFLQIWRSFANNMPVVLLKEDQLTWSVGRAAFKYPVFEVKKNKFPVAAGEIRYDVDQQFVRSHKANNVIGFIPGTHPKKKKKYVLFTAHYDHLGRMGRDQYFPGANDNASGVSMLISLARHYAAHPPEYSLVFIAFAGEEAGLLGSTHFVAHPWVKMNRIRFVVNLDILGTGEEGIKVVNGSVYRSEFDLMQKINAENSYLPAVKIRGEAANSDHHPFHANGVPAVFIYTLGGIAHYHNIYDKPDTLPLTGFTDLFHLLSDFTDRLPLH